MMVVSLLQALAGQGQMLDPIDYFGLAVGFLAILLLVISLIAYRRAGLRRVLFVSAAFVLFAAKLFVQHLDLFVANIDGTSIELYLTVIDLFILLLFFLALIRR